MDGLFGLLSRVELRDQEREPGATSRAFPDLESTREGLGAGEKSRPEYHRDD